MSDQGPRPYVVQPGDTLLRIALLYELEPDVIWEHEKNAKLKAKRDPDLLAPGDLLFIPAPEPPTLDIAPGASNGFRARVPQVHVHLRFIAEEGPMAGEAYVLEGGPEPVEGTLDGDGYLSLTLPASTRRLRLAFPERDVEHELLVGHLDPIERSSGLRARLLHLGYLPVERHSQDPYHFPTKASQKYTVERFQRSFGLEPTGYYDPDTGDALRKAHGS